MIAANRARHERGHRMAWLMVANGARRVVVTGLGAVTPLGNDARTTWSELLAGQSGAGPITLFDASGFVVGFACEVKDFEPTDWIERKQVRRIDRFAQLIVAAARQAEVDAALEIAKECERVGASVATAMGGLKSLEECTDTLIERGPDRCQPVCDPGDHPEHGRGLGLDRARHARPTRLPVHRLRGLADGDRRGPGRDPARPRRRDALRRQRGGDHARWARRLRRHARALDGATTIPHSASRPFDRDRDGFVLGEAGAILVLEELEHAQATRREDLRRAARLRALLRRLAHHRARPDRRAPARAMRMAFARRRLNPDEIDYINAHGTSTPLGDASETRAIKHALGEETASRTPSPPPRA